MLLRMAGFLAFFLLLNTGAAFAKEHPDYEAGAAAYSSGDYIEAEKMFEAALNINPNDAYAHFGLGDTMAALGRSGNASAEYQRCIELAPQSVVADRARAGLKCLGAPVLPVTPGTASTSSKPQTLPRKSGRHFVAESLPLASASSPASASRTSAPSHFSMPSYSSSSSSSSSTTFSSSSIPSYSLLPPSYSSPLASSSLPVPTPPSFGPLPSSYGPRRRAQSEGFGSAWHNQHRHGHPSHSHMGYGGGGFSSGYINPYPFGRPYTPMMEIRTYAAVPPLSTVGSSPVSDPAPVELLAKQQRLVTDEKPAH